MCLALYLRREKDLRQVKTPSTRKRKDAQSTLSLGIMFFMFVEALRAPACRMANEALS
jgi:hypothetical protein